MVPPEYTPLKEETDISIMLDGLSGFLHASFVTKFPIIKIKVVG